MFVSLLHFLLPCWIINLSLNSLYVAKLILPAIRTADYCLDGNKQWWDHNRILGNSTTVIGFGVAVTTGFITSVLLSESRGTGIIFGFTVYFGHTLGSFIKRRAHYKDGQFMPVVDHGDYILLSGLVFGLLHRFSWQIILIGIVITYVVHPVITFGAYKLNLHKYPL